MLPISRTWETEAIPHHLQDGKLVAGPPDKLILSHPNGVLGWASISLLAEGHAAVQSDGSGWELWTMLPWFVFHSPSE